MPYDGHGIFTPLITFVPDTDATAEDQNAQDGDFADGLSNVLTRDGQAPATADISLGGFKLVEVGTGTDPTDAATVAQIRNVLQAPLAFYVNSVTGSDSNNGTDPSTPFLTPQHASDLLQRDYDLGGFAVDIYCAKTGTIYSPVNVIGTYPGDTGNLVTFHGSENRTITGATNASPIVITTNGHGFTNGTHVVISGVRGNMAANGAYVVSAATTNTFALLKEVDNSNSTGNGAYVAGTGICSAPRDVQVVSTASGPAFGAQTGASFNILGFSVSSIQGEGLAAIGAGSRIITKGPIDFSFCAASQAYGTRRGYIEIGYNFSISSGSLTEWSQGSHYGEVRKLAEGFFTASVSYANFGNFVFVDCGEIIETGSTEPTRTITGATNSTPIVVTSPNHGYNAGDFVQIVGVFGNNAANGTFIVGTATTNTFTTLNTDGSPTVGSGAYVSGGSASRVLRGITNATNASPIVITSALHGYTNGEVCIITTVAGNTAANGAWTVANTTANTFELVGSTGNGAYTASTGLLFNPGISWNQQGFSVPLSGTLRQFQSNQNGQIQAQGNYPPPPNYYPGNNGGAVYLGAQAPSDSTWISLPGNSFIIYAGASSGFIVENNVGSLPLFQVLNSGLATFARTVGMGSRAAITSTILALPAPTTANSQLNLAGGTAPTAPSDGDIWYDGTNLKMRVSGVTKTFTLV